MKIVVLHDDLSENIYDIKELMPVKEYMVIIDSSSKEKSALGILNAYINGKKQILFDKNNDYIKEVINEVDFKDIDFSMLLFTSGTTGKPVGAFKSLQNLEEEVYELEKLVAQFNPKRVICTVPLIHIYGILTSIILPYKLDVDLFLKEHFLPHDLLANIKPNSIIVTTPLYIKALLRLNEQINLKDVVFISSTAPLDELSAKEFIEKFDTNLIQLFGSTETGGIAYKMQTDLLWTPIPKVHAKVNEVGALNISSPFVSQLLYENGFKKTNGVIQSFDYVEFENDKFKIIGRNSQIFKVGGKRYSSLRLEEVLESLVKVEKAYVNVSYNKSELKDEVLEIYLQSKDRVSIKEVNEIIKEKIGNIKFSIKLKTVDKIPTTSLGKKIMPI